MSVLEITFTVVNGIALGIGWAVIGVGVLIVSAAGGFLCAGLIGDAYKRMAAPHLFWKKEGK